jgi:signal transduction histidine kinase
MPETDPTPPRANDDPLLPPEDRIPDHIPGLLAAIREEIHLHPERSPRLRAVAEGETILQEFCVNHALFLILEGMIQLTKAREDEADPIVVDRLEAGSLLGLISVTTGEVTMTTARAVTSAEVLVIEREELEQLGLRNPRLKALLDPLIIRNLAERYRRLVGSNLEIHDLARELQHERNQLRETLHHLEETRFALISREKLATLGQLVAGLAHELNNPAAALVHSTSLLRDKLEAVFSRLRPLWAETLTTAWSRPATVSSEQRSRMEELSLRFPDLPRPLLRPLSLLPPAFLDSLPPELLQTDPGNASSAAQTDLQDLLDVFASGSALRSIDVSSARVVRLVQSLQRYSREGTDHLETFNPADGIRDTLDLLQKPLRHIDVTAELDGWPSLHGKVGPLNQVWTNLISNAAQAMQGRGQLRIRAEIHDPELWIYFEDSGPGVPPELREKIFTLNFTTKSGSTEFGLGLGLSISRDILRQHGGSIEVHSASPPLSGACFLVRLPLAPGS